MRVRDNPTRDPISTLASDAPDRFPGSRVEGTGDPLERGGADLSLQRLSGASIALGGALATAAWLFFAVVDPARAGHAEPWWVPVNLAVTFGGIFMAFGLPGFHARQAARTGWLGAVGIVVFFVGMLVAYVAVQQLEAMTMPVAPAGLRTLVGIGAPTLFVGALVTGVVTIRAGLYPRAVGVVLVANMALALFDAFQGMPAWLPGSVLPAVFTATMAYIGVVLAMAPSRPGVPH